MVAAALACLLLAACGDQEASSEVASEEGQRATAECGPVEELADAGHFHLSGDAEPPAEYETSPPTSGWHVRERDQIADAFGVHEEPLAERLQVSVLAVDGAVVAHRDLSDADRDALEAQAGEAFDGQPVAVTPFDGVDPGEVALTSWATMQVCDGVDLDTVDAFLAEHAADTPDFTMDAEHDEHDEHD